jgi:integrase
LRPEDGRIEIRRTEHFATKTDESERDVDLAPEVCDLVRRFKEFPDPDPVFVLRGGSAKPDARYEYYRANLAPWRTWKKLSTWLRSKGIRGTKPIHGLRKAAGSLIHEHHGIEAARSFLGHADISTTCASYVDKKPRVAVSFASALQTGANVDNAQSVLSGE